MNFSVYTSFLEIRSNKLIIYEIINYTILVIDLSKRLLFFYFLTSGTKRLFLFLIYVCVYLLCKLVLSQINQYSNYINILIMCFNGII